MGLIRNNAPRCSRSALVIGKKHVLWTVVSGRPYNSRARRTHKDQIPHEYNEVWKIKTMPL